MGAEAAWREGGVRADRVRASVIRERVPSGVAVLLCWGVITPCAVVPASAQTLKFARIGSIAGPADLVDVRDGYAYLVSGHTLTLVDVSNPAAPKRTGAYTFPQKIWGFKVIGSLVYVAADFFGLGILDISNTSAPTLRGSFTTPGQAKNVAVFGTKALVADHMSGVDLLDLSNLAKPVSVGSFFMEGYAKDVVSSGLLVYAVDAPAGLYVFDLAKPNPLEPVNSQQSTTAPASIEFPDDPSAPGPKIACLVGGGSLQVYDVTNPVAPIRVATFRTPSGRPLRASMRGGLAYVADGPEGLVVVDLSTPTNPGIAGTFKTASPARDVAVAGSLVFVAVGNAEGSGEVLILRQTR